MKKYLLFIGIILGLTNCNQEDDTYHYEEYSNNYKTELIYQKGEGDLNDSIIGQKQQPTQEQVEMALAEGDG